MRTVKNYIENGGGKTVIGGELAFKADSSLTYDLAIAAHVIHFHVAAADAIAADTDGIHAALDGAAHVAVTTGIANPAVPRNITATAGGTAASIKAIQVVVTGTNFEDDEITETLPAFTVDTEGTVVGNKAFKTVIQIDIPAHDATSATTAIGWGDKLGLPCKLAYDTVIPGKTFLNKVKETTDPTVAVSAAAFESNTIELNSALDGTAVDSYFFTT